LSPESERVAADEQDAAAGFYKMDFSRFDAPENGARRGLRERSRFVRSEHANLGRTLVAPDDVATAQANRRPLPLLDGDFSFGFRSYHLLKSVRR